MFLLQIPASFIKYFLLGQSEKGGIGTLSLTGGSISAILPLFAIAYAFSAYLFNRKKIYLILILCFTMFGIIGAKRLIVLMIPIILLFTLFIFILKTKKININLIFKYVPIALLGGMFLFYLGVRLSPTLNPDHKMMGKFDMNYAINYTLNYASSSDKSFTEMRRSEGLKYFTKYLYDKGWQLYPGKKNDNSRP